MGADDISVSGQGSLHIAPTCTDQAPVLQNALNDIYAGMVSAFAGPFLLVSSEPQRRALHQLAERHILAYALGAPDEAEFLSNLIVDLAISDLFLASPTTTEPATQPRTATSNDACSAFARVVQWVAAEYTPSVLTNGLPEALQRLFGDILTQTSRREAYSTPRSVKRLRKTARNMLLGRTNEGSVWAPMYTGLLRELSALHFGVFGGAQREVLIEMSLRYTLACRELECDQLGIFADFVTDLVTTGVLQPRFHLDVSSRRRRLTDSRSSIDRHSMLRTAERVARWFGGSFTPAVPLPELGGPLARFMETALEDCETVDDISTPVSRPLVAEAVLAVLTTSTVEIGLQSTPDDERDQCWRRIFHLEHLEDPRSVNPDLGTVAQLEMADPSDWIGPLEEFRDYVSRRWRNRGNATWAPDGFLHEAIAVTGSDLFVVEHLTRLVVDYHDVVLRYLFEDDQVYLRRQLSRMLANDAREGRISV